MFFFVYETSLESFAITRPSSFLFALRCCNTILEPHLSKDNKFSISQSVQMLDNKVKLSTFVSKTKLYNLWRFKEKEATCSKSKTKHILF